MIVLIRIIAVSILALILLSFLYSKSEKLGKRSKFIALLLSVLLIFLIVFYEITLERQTKAHRELLDAFNQGKTLICGTYEVSGDKFNFSGGTKVFLGKESIKELQGVMIQIDKCELK
jgi:hypothetical protein